MKIRKIRALVTALLLIILQFITFAWPLTAQPWMSMESFNETVTSQKWTPGLIFGSWQTTAFKEYDIGNEEGTITYNMGVSSIATNVIRWEVWEKDNDQMRFPERYVRTGVFERFHNRYATGGMVTNVIEDFERSRGFFNPDLWLVGTRYRETGFQHRIIEKSNLSIRYSNTNNMSTWAIKHIMQDPNGLTFNITKRIGPMAEMVVSLGLRTVKKESGGSAWAYWQDYVMFIPDDTVGNEENFWNPYRYQYYVPYGKY